MPQVGKDFLVCPHPVLVSVIINYTNMAATSSHMRLCFLKSKVKFCFISTLS